MAVFRLHLDENCARSIANGLRQAGIDVTLSSEVGLLESTDEEQLEFAGADGRVLFTQDSDFLALHERGLPHAGIIYRRKDRLSNGEIIRRLTEFWEILDDTDMLGKREYL